MLDTDSGMLYLHKEGTAQINVSASIDNIAS